MGDRRIAIIGGGVIGLATAYRLAKEGAAVTVLERGTAGGGATLASLGALWPSRPTIKGPLQQLQRASLWQLEQFVAEVAADGGRQVSFVRDGHIELLTSQKAMDDARRDAAACADWPTFGRPYAMRVVPSGEALPDGITGTPFGALHSAVTAQVEVGEFVTALELAARRHGAVVREHAEARVSVSDGQASVAVGGERIDADEILVAAGAWTALLHPTLAAAAPTRPVKGQALEVLASRDMPPGIVRCEKVYLVPWGERGRRVLIGSTTEKNAGFDTSVDAAAVQGLLAKAQQFCPALCGATVVRAWAGLRPDAPKHRPIMGRVPGVANLLVTAGHFKTGIGLSARVAQAICDLILKGASPELAPFAP